MRTISWASKHGGNKHFTDQAMSDIPLTCGLALVKHTWHPITTLRSGRSLQSRKTFTTRVGSIVFNW